MLPIVLLSVFGIVNLFLGFLRSNRVLLPFALVVLALVFGLNLLDWNHAGSLSAVLDSSYVAGMLTVDNFSVAFSGIVLLTALLLLPFSRSLPEGLREVTDLPAMGVIELQLITRRALPQEVADTAIIALRKHFNPSSTLDGVA